MPTATLTRKGQITIPIAVRTALNLQTGSTVEFVMDDTGFKVIPRRGVSSPLKGRFAGRVQQPVSIESMDDAIACEVALSHGISKE